MPSPPPPLVINRPNLQKLLHSPLALLATDTRVTEAAERRERIGSGAVDEHLPGTQLARHAAGPLRVRRPNRAGEPIRGSVGYADGLCLIVVSIRNDAQHGAEDFLLRQARLRIDIAEDRRLDEVSFLQPSRRAQSARHQAMSLVDSDLNVLLNLVALSRGC